MNDWKSKIIEMDRLIREGKSAVVRDEVKGLQRADIPREHYAELASISYRVALPAFGLKLLNPLVRPVGKKKVEATAAEVAEYAYGLIRIGAEEEAVELLKGISRDEVPRADFYEAACHINRWAYDKSIEPLKRYIDSPKIGAYEKLVAQVNLAAAYLYVQDAGNADLLLKEIHVESEAQQQWLVFAKCMQLKAENFILQKKFDLAVKALDAASERFKETAGLDRLFVRKLRLFIELHSRGPNPSVVKGFLELANEAKEQGNWETVRECDRILALYAGDKKRLSKLYFGTPFNCYRSRLMPETTRFGIPKSYEWQIGEGRSSTQVFELEQSTYGNRESFDRGSVMYLLLKALCEDFYRPVRIATLHQRLYPGEYFNLQSSPARVHRVINRLRGWIAANGLPLQINESAEFYYLVATGPFAIRVSEPGERVQQLPDAIERLRSLYNGQEFSMSEASSKLDIPVRTLSRLVNTCIEEGLIEKWGAGPTTRYSFSQMKKAA